MAVLDSSAVIHIISGTSTGFLLNELYKKQMTAVTTITVHEVLIGLKGVEREKIVEYFKTLDVLSFDLPASLKSVEVEETLARKGTPLAKADMFIASICLEKGEALITTDNDFKRVPGLKILTV